MKTTQPRLKSDVLTTRVGHKFLTVFAPALSEGRAILDPTEFSGRCAENGVRTTDIKRALADGILRRGVTGYWLAEEADPGFLAIMRGALAERAETDHDAQ